MGTVREAALRLRLIDQFTGQGHKILAGMAAVDAALKRFGNGLGAIRDGFNRGAANAQADFARTAVAAAALAAVVVKPVRAAMELEDAMADIRKVTTLSDEALGGLRDRLVQISREVPMAASELAGLAAELAAAGTADTELERMTMLTARAGVAFGVTGQVAGENLGKIRAALGLTVPETEHLADAMNALSDGTASSAPDLMDFARRVGSMGKQYGFTTDQVLAIGSAMVSAGATSEQAATGFQAVGRALVKGTAATGPQVKALKRLGLTSKDVAKAMSKDALATTQDVLKRIRQLPEWERASVMNQLFGDEARTFLPLVENTDLLATSLGILADKGLVTGSVLREFETRIGTTSGKVKMMANRAMAAGIALGNALLPAIRDGADAFGPLLDRAGNFIQSNERFVERLAKVTAGMVAARLAASALRVGVYALLRPSNLLVAALGYLAHENFDTLAESARQLMAVGEQLANSQFVKNFMAGAGDMLDKMAAGARSLATALAELAGPRSAFGEWLNSAAGAGWGKTLGEVAVGLAALAAAGAAFGAIAGPLKLAVNAILLVSGIKPALGLLRWLRGVGLVSSGISSAAGALERVNSAAVAAGRIRRPSIWGMLLGAGVMADMVSNLPKDEKGIQEFIRESGKRTAGWNEWLKKHVGTPRTWLGLDDARPGPTAADLEKQRADIVDQMDAVKASAASGDPGAAVMGDIQLQSLQRQLDQIDAQLKAIAATPVKPQVDSSSIDRALDKANALRAALAGAGGVVGTPANTNSFGGPRAAGGPVQAGKTYLVGEKGPEPFIPRRSGTILPNSALGGTTINATFNLHGKATEEDAMMILRKLNHIVARSQATMWGGLAPYGE